MEQTTKENKKGFFQNDRLLVCSMLSFYGLCIIGLIGGTFIWLGKRNETISANATSTAAVIATQRANATTTAVARMDEQDRYEYIERFNTISGQWFVGTYEKQYGDAKITIKDGVYIWDIRDSKSYTQATMFYWKNTIKDFDVYMDMKFIDGSSFGGTCAGFFFRKPDNDWNNGAYIFTICNDSHYKIDYYEKNSWQAITYSNYEDSIQRSDWNRIEISARGESFMFTINNIKVFEMTDNRLKSGDLGIFINVDKNNSAKFWFDNFGFQHR